MANPNTIEIGSEMERDLERGYEMTERTIYGMIKMTQEDFQELAQEPDDCKRRGILRRILNWQVRDDAMAKHHPTSAYAQQYCTRQLAAGAASATGADQAPQDHTDHHLVPRPPLSPRKEAPSAPHKEHTHRPRFNHRRHARLSHALQAQLAHHLHHAHDQ